MNINNSPGKCNSRQHLSRLGYEIPPPRRADADQPALWESGGPAADSGGER